MSSSSKGSRKAHEVVTFRLRVVFPHPGTPVEGAALAVTGPGNAVTQRFSVNMSQRPLRAVRVEGPTGPTPCPPGAGSS